MGWWRSADNGGIAELQGVTSDTVWGDGPADVLGNAFDEIAEMFKAEVGRDMTAEDLRRGIEFSFPFHEEGKPHV